MVTCGGSIGGTGGVLKDKLKARGIHLSNVYSLVMPDNAMLYYNIADQDKALQQLRQADASIEQIKSSIGCREAGAIKGSILTPIFRMAYHSAKSTKKFYVTDSCIGCGLCEKNCQDHAISMMNGKPTWVKPQCTKCTACINGCPQQAIQYGRATEKRNRYLNPFV